MTVVLRARVVAQSREALLDALASIADDIRGGATHGALGFRSDWGLLEYSDEETAPGAGREA